MRMKEWIFQVCKEKTGTTKRPMGHQSEKNMKNKNSGSKSGNFANAFIECFLMNGFGKNHTDELSASSEK